MKKNKYSFIQLLITFLSLFINDSYYMNLNKKGREGIDEHALDRYNDLKENIASSLSIMFKTLILIAIIGLCLGKICHDDTISFVKLFNVIGIFFTGWGTVFILGNIYESNSGETLYDHMRIFVFKFFFIIGAFFLFLGAIV